MAVVIVARRRHKHNKRRWREQVFSARVNIFGMTEEKIIETYRLSSDAILELLEEPRANLEQVTRRSHAISCMAKLLSALHFLASGSFHRTVAISAGISQSSFSGVLSHVLNAMSCRMGRYIQFPPTPDTLFIHYWSDRLHAYATCPPVRQRAHL